MQFIIIGIDGKPLCDDAERPVVLHSRDQALQWIKPGESVLPYIAPRLARSVPQSGSIKCASSCALSLSLSSLISEAV